MDTSRERKLNRLPGYDYSHSGFYVVTVCTHKRIEYFGEIKKGRMLYSIYGLIVNRMWHSLPWRYPYITLNEYIVMPNHFHGIIYIDTEYMRTAPELSLPMSTPIKSLSKIISVFKVCSSRLIHDNGLPEFKWQRSFFDNIIRNETQLENFRRYIKENPERWWRDRNNFIFSPPS